MVTMPPRHGKSRLVSRDFPSWYIGKFPLRDIISTSYGSDLSWDFSRDVRNRVASPPFQSLFPGMGLAPDSKSKARWHTNKGGGYVAAGVGSAITGRGAHILNIDDPVKDRMEAESATVRESIWNWYRSVAYTRLAPGGAVILTMTRWHEDDLAGRLIDAEESGEGDKWDKIDFPAILPDGRALWEDRFPLEVLEQIRRTLGERDWESLYMQRPRPPGGSFFSIDSFLVGGEPIPDEKLVRVDSIYAVVDTAAKTGKTRDGVGVVYFARTRAGITPLAILDWDLHQMEGAMLETWLPTVFERLEQLCQKHKARFGSAGVWIEDKSSGIILLQQAQRKGLNVSPIDTKLTSLGKSERAINVSGYIHAGEVKIVKSAYDKVSTYKGRTRNHLLGQVLAFDPSIKDMGEDDLLDCNSYGIALGIGNREGF